MEKKWNIWHILGHHKYKNCIEYGDYGLGGETEIRFSSPWAMFGVRYTHYQCKECGRKFWMHKGNFEEIKSQELFLESLNPPLSFNS